MNPRSKAPRLIRLGDHQGRRSGSGTEALPPTPIPGVLNHVAHAHAGPQILDVAGIDTGSQRRDDHPRIGIWFDAERRSGIAFPSTSVRRVVDDRLVPLAISPFAGSPGRSSPPTEILGIQDTPGEMQ